ncbi:MAG: hypothetical protein ABI863_14715 [Ginsengibacter sp.]
MAQNTKPENSSASNSNYVWTKLTDSATFQKSYNFQMMVVRESL